MPLVKHRKVVMLGFPGVGKTSLAMQFVKGEFPKDYDPTFQNNWNKTFTLGNDEFELDVVDTAGQVEYSLIPHAYVFGIHGYIVVYSVGCERSFQIARGLHNYLEELHGKCPVPILLVGNKCDLAPQGRLIKYEDGKKLAESWGAAFMEVSAKSPEQSKLMFFKVIQEIDRLEKAIGNEKTCKFM